MPKLSIITINRNNKRGLQRTIQSVIQQTFSDYEYIIVDGASTDGSIDILKNISLRPISWESKPDVGVYNAMNKGIDKASGEYCLFLNSGDELKTPDTLDDFFRTEFIEDIVYGNIEDNERVIIYPDILTFYNIRWGTLPHPATLIKRKLFEILGKYNEQYKVASDWEFWMKAIIINNCSYKHINQILTVVELAGISAVKLEYDEGITILNSLFPKRILDDYNRFKEIENSNDNTIYNWLIKKKLLYFIIRLLYSISKRSR